MEILEGVWKGFRGVLKSFWMLFSTWNLKENDIFTNHSIFINYCFYAKLKISPEVLFYKRNTDLIIGKFDMVLGWM